MKNEFKIDTAMILSVAVLTVGLFAGGVTSMVTNDGSSAVKAEAVQLAATTKVRPVSI